MCRYIISCANVFGKKDSTNVSARNASKDVSVVLHLDERIAGINVLSSNAIKVQSLNGMRF
jgi:hypothetical protein